MVHAMPDQAIAVAANSSGGSAMILESKINFLSGVPAGGRLEAEARPVEKKRKIGVWSVVVRQEDGGVLVAAGQEEKREGHHGLLGI
jgi:acyl-coenzyme A thioesterase PaaI-like protein